MKKPNFTLDVPAETIADRVLLTTDTEACNHLAQIYLQNTVHFNAKKNFDGYTGTYLGKRITVINAGIGSASIGMLAEDLYANYGVESIVSVGVCDALVEEIKPHRYVLAVSASTDSNYPDLLGLPGAVAPTADFELTAALANDFAARKKLANQKYEDPILYTGPILTSDRRLSDPLEAEEWTEAGLIAADTCTAALFIRAQKAGKKAASLMLVDRNLITGEELPGNHYGNCAMRQFVVAMANV